MVKTKNAHALKVVVVDNATKVKNRNAIKVSIEGGDDFVKQEDIARLETKIAALETDLTYKGIVASYAELPETGADGDTYLAEDTGVIYVYVGTEEQPWVPLNEYESPVFDIVYDGTSFNKTVDEVEEAIEAGKLIRVYLASYWTPDWSTLISRSYAYQIGPMVEDSSTSKSMNLAVFGSSKSGAVKNSLVSLSLTINTYGSQKVLGLSFCSPGFFVAPNSSNYNYTPSSSAQIYEALQRKQDILGFDAEPLEGSTNPVSSGGLYEVIKKLDLRIAALEEA